MRTAAVLAALCGVCACSSQPEADRSTLPERPEAYRPDGVEPEGLAEIREALAEQRAETRERENALVLEPDELTTHSAAPWYETVLWPFAELLHFLRNL